MKLSTLLLSLSFARPLLGRCFPLCLPGVAMDTESDTDAVRLMFAISSISFHHDMSLIPGSGIFFLFFYSFVMNRKSWGDWSD